MSAPLTVHLLSTDPELENAVRAALADESDARLVAPAESTLPHPGERADVVVLDGTGDVCRIAELCARLRQHPATAAALIVTALEPEALEARASALEAGSDELIARRPDPAESRLRMRAALQVVRMRRLVEERDAELRTSRAALARKLEETLALLQNLVEMGLPGAGDRGRRVADLAARVAERFGIPATLLPDMATAAHLHELGRLVTATARGGAPLPAADAWQYALPSRAILRHVEGLKEAAELVGGMYENWDGTGFPDHLRQGQIPLRCRILRSAVDLFSSLERLGGPSVETVLADFSDHAGTRYDPMVIVHMRAVLQGTPEGEVRGDRVLLPVTDLHAGMVLAEDLYTDGGLKLLARGSRISIAVLETILRRHRTEPILQAAAVLRGRTT